MGKIRTLFDENQALTFEGQEIRYGIQRRVKGYLEELDEEVSLWDVATLIADVTYLEVAKRILFLRRKKEEQGPNSLEPLGEKQDEST